MRMVFVALFATLPAMASPVIAPRLAVPIEIDRGDLLWNELNCAACHTGAPNEGRTAPRVGPVLGERGLKLTPQFLRAYLADPHARKPGTTMPDLRLDAGGVEALVHFLAPGADDSAGAAADAGRIAQGRRLFHTVGCVGCHAPEESLPPGTALPPELIENSIPIGRLASKMTVGELTKFLLDPVKYRKSGRMPSLRLSEGEAQMIAMYLLRAQTDDPKAVAAAKNIEGLKYEYFETDFSGEPDWSKFAPKESGAVANFSVQNRKRDQSFGFRYSGSLKVPKAGKYNFWTVSDDGSRLYIDGNLVVDNGGEHAPTEKMGSVELTEGRHAIELTFYNNGAGYELRVLWQIPGARRTEIPSDALSHLGQPMLPLEGENFVRDGSKAEKGKALFASLGCAACHEHAEVKALAVAAKSFQQLGATGGCLDERVKTGLPDFHFNVEQRADLQKFLANKEARAKKPTPEVEIWNTMAAFNCVACHTRDGKGGPTDARLQYYTISGEGDLGDEGRIPPHLTKVGQKLRRDWMTEVLEKGASVRPYMATRMPQFGSAGVGPLPALFEKADGAETKADSGGTPLEEKYGRKLVGAGGLTCISCHTFANRKSLGIPAIDLTTMTRRLKKDWFHRYVIDPAALRPGTRMPTFWPNGEAANKEILDGKTDAQIDAIWAYLARGREADLPPGLVTGKKEIVATTEAVIYRNFIQGGGSRAIGVGYPEKANLAFDANALRLAEIWQGSFIDAAHHSNGRGEGFEPPLGDRVYTLPPGPGFAMLESTNAPWPEVAVRAPNFKMRGYNFDDKMRPTFRYAFGDIAIEDYPVAEQGEVDPFLRRTVTLKAKEAVGNIWFRAAVGDKIEGQKDGSFTVDKKVNFKVTGGESLVRKAGAKSELLVRLDLQNKSAQFVEEIRW